jgi:hypothetical protein
LKFKMADEKTIQEEAGLDPEHWQPVDVAPVVPAKGVTPILGTTPNRMSNTFQGSLSPQLQHDSTFVGTAYGGPGIPSHPLMPLGVQGNPIQNAGVSSTVKIVGGASSADVDLPPVTDGLVHGDPIWVVDPSYVILRDDFLPGSYYGPGGPGSPNSGIGQLGWNASAASNTTIRMGRGPNHMGEYHMGNSGSVDQINILTFLSPSAASTTIGWALLDYPGWQMTFVFRFHRPIDSSSAALLPGPNFLQKAMYIGMFNTAADYSTVSRPPQFLGLRYDTSATAPAISDITMKFEVVGNPMVTPGARNNTQGQVIDTGITPAEDVYYRLDIKCSTVGVVTMSVNGGTTATFTVPTQTIANDNASQQVGAGFGQGVVKMGTTCTPGIPPFGQGSKVLIAGLTAGNAFLNGQQILNQATAGNQTNNDVLDFPSSGTQGLNGPTGFTATGLPAYYPMIAFGNDDTAAPTTNDCMFAIDYFGYVWNGGLAGQTPSSTLSRYYLL